MTVPQQRPPQPWHSTAGPQRAPGPPMPPPAAYPPPAHPSAGEGTAMTALRVTTYVLTSIASLLFILLVLYGVVKVSQLRDAVATTPLGGLSSSSYQVAPNGG